MANLLQISEQRLHISEKIVNIVKNVNIRIMTKQDASTVFENDGGAPTIIKLAS